MITRIDLGQEINTLKPGLIALRRELHRHPELAFEEVWTAATLAGRMRSLGLAVEEGIGGTGVLAVLEGARRGKTCSSARTWTRCPWKRRRAASTPRRL